MENSKQLEIERQKVGTWGHLVKERVDVVEKYADNRVLDVGCSNGAYVRYLCNYGCEAYGCDLLPDKKWRSKFRSRFLVADVLHLPYKDQAFDTIIAFEILEHLKDVDSGLKELYRVTRKNIIISVPNCFQPPVFQQSGLAFHHWIDRTHKQFFTKDSLKNTLQKNGFRIYHLEYINPVAPEILLLSSWRFSLRITRRLVRLANRIPFRKKYYMTLLVVASKDINVE